VRPRAGAHKAPLAAIVVMDATGSPPFDNERMFYRLNYADPLQARTYANSRWTANPLQLVTQRFKSRLAQAGAQGAVGHRSATGVPVLRIESTNSSHTSPA
jgi:cholesterol transport system auxiliary component